MKRFLLIVFGIAVLSSCSKTNFKISGEVTDAAIPPKVYLNVMMHDGAIRAIDSSSIDNGSFTLDGKVKKTEVGFIQFSNEATFPVIIEKGSIKVKINYKKWDEFEISGTRANEQLSRFHAKYHSLWADADSAYVKYNRMLAANAFKGAEKDSLRNDVIKKYNAMLDYSKTFVTDNNKNIVSIAALWFVHKGLTQEDYKSLSNIISSDYKYSHLFRLMQEQANGKLPQ